jgi:hypothetical protein
MPPNLTPGDIYSFASGNGRYFVLRVLAVDAEAVHVRTYKRKFATRWRESSSGGVWL